MLLSVTEDEDKPPKYPAIFSSADVGIITKSDLASAVEFDEAVARRNGQAVQRGREVFKLSAKTGQRMGEYLRLLESWRANSPAAAAVSK